MGEYADPALGVGFMDEEGQALKNPQGLPVPPYQPRDSGSTLQNVEGLPTQRTPSDGDDRVSIEPESGGN